MAVKKRAQIDSTVSYLHYRLTVIILFVSSLLLGFQYLLHKPISCMQVLEMPTQLLDTICWTHSTYTTITVIPNVVLGAQTPNVVPEERVYQWYYKWMCWALLVQAVFFYGPHFVWKRFENCLTEKLSEGLTDPFVEASKKRQKMNQLSEFLHQCRLRPAVIGVMPLIYVGCQLANLVNILLQLFFMDRFFNKQFFSYGYYVMFFRTWGSSFLSVSESLSKVFPTLAKCSYTRMGPSGLPQNISTQCVLPLNSFAEWIYLFLWFWLHGLLLITFLSLVFSFCRLFSKKLQMFSILHYCSLLSVEDVSSIVQNGKLTNWFALYQLSKNVNVLHFYDLIIGLKKDKLSLPNTML